MTMLPAATTHHNLSKQDHQLQQQESYVGLFCGGGTVMSRLEVEVEGYCNSINKNIYRESELLLGSDMGEEDQSGSNKSTGVDGCGSIGNNNHHQLINNNQQGDQEKEERWLQLSIGRQRREGEEFGGSSSLVELNLLPHSNSEPCRPLLPPSALPAQLGGCITPLLNFSYPQPPPPPQHNQLFQQLQYPHTVSAFAPNHQSFSNWAFPPTIPFTMPSSSSSSSSSSSFPLTSHHLAASYFPRPFHFPTTPAFHDYSAAGPSSDFRVVEPPRRPHSGIWFMLQASPNQAKEPFLPQIPKSYLRIKDGRMAVRLLLKYLVNKLRLQSESEIEIRCRGQQLGPLLTLEEVRDNIWSPMTPALLSDPSTTDHIMVLYYGRCA